MPNPGQRVDNPGSPPQQLENRHGTQLTNTAILLLPELDEGGKDPMRCLIFALSVSGVVFAAFAAPAKDMAARTELHAIDTLTLSDAQFLSGDANGRRT